MSILFQHEWKNSNGVLRALPHTATKNDSFLRTCTVLKKLGVKNYAFPLTLYDQDLKDVDVYALEENTPENEILRTKVQTEARRNAWYFLRECIRIYEQGGEPVRFRLDRGSTAMVWTFLNGIDYATMQPRQTGKEQPLSAHIRTPEGWSTMGDMETGKKIVAPDGTITTVVGVYPQGMKDIYRVRFEDGRWTDCGLEHLWKVYHSHWEPSDTRWRVIKLKDILEHFRNRPNSQSGFSVPLIEPEEKEDVDLPLDPYLVGVLLGDGGLTNGARLSTKDDFILNEVKRLVPEGTELVFDSGVDYRIIDRTRTPSGRTSPFLNTIRSLEMNKLSYKKSIPDSYMSSSPLQRWSLLQGLMDTDGTVDKSSSCSFCTTSLKMAHQVQDLVRSLGGICTIREKKSFYTHNNERREGRLAFILRIRVKEPKRLFRLPRKKDLVTDSYKSADTLKLRMQSIEYVGKQQAQCIEVDHPDHLYITNGYTVTHNTVGALSLSAWIIYIAGYDSQMGMMAKDNALREENVKRVKSFGENLPKWWIAADRFNDKNNTSEIYYKALKTHYVTYVAQADPRKADLNARGASPPTFHFDEFEFTINIKISYPTILASTGTARENARKNGKPHSNIITTTAGDPKKQECKDAAEILSGAMPFSEFLYDVESSEKLHQIVKSASSQKMIIGVFSHLQLGYSNEWLKEKIERNRMTRDQVLRDYLNRRVSIQAKPVIPAQTLAKISASEEEVKHVQILSDRFVIRWYISEAERESLDFLQRPIVVGSDSSEMIGRDATTLVGIDPRDLSTVFTFKCNEANINLVGVFIAQLLMMYPKMILVPENKSSGTSLIDIVTIMLRQRNQNPFLRIFNWIVDRKDEEEFSKYNYRDMNLIDTVAKRYFGFKTDKSKRDELFGKTLLNVCEKAATKVKDQTLIGELGSLVERNGRVDHDVGMHDDTVFAWLLAAWFVMSAKHLDVYGITPGTALQYVDAGTNSMRRGNAEKQDMVSRKMAELEQMYKGATDPVTRRIIMSDIHVLKDMMDKYQMVIPKTTDDLIRDPNKFTNPELIRSGKPPLTTDMFKNNLNAFLGLSQSY